MHGDTLDSLKSTVHEETNADGLPQNTEGTMAVFHTEPVSLQCFEPQ